ncbi:hypothetical protein AYK25_08930 [Thermoplasmatales archaeon SM1-50]|nr:MAG: hypothetical protein AYK25_08930 [Thermoplasmatales archaeon SM1-50]
MNDYFIGFITGVPIGTAVGIAIEIAIGLNQKPWAELSDEEKKLRKNTILFGLITLLLGLIVFLWLMLP